MRFLKLLHRKIRSHWLIRPVIITLSLGLGVLLLPLFHKIVFFTAVAVTAGLRLSGRFNLKLKLKLPKLNLDQKNRRAAVPTSAIPAQTTAVSTNQDAPGLVGLEGEGKIRPRITAFGPVAGYRSNDNHLDNVLTGVLELLKHAFEFYTANVFLIDENDAETLVQRAYSTRADHIVRLARIKVGSGLVGWVAKNEKPLCLSNINHSSRSLGYYQYKERIGSFLAVPIHVKGKIRGVLSLDHTDPDHFPSPKSERMLAEVATLISFAINADEMTGQAVSSAQVYQDLYVLITELHAQDSFKGVSEKLVEGVARIISAESVSLLLYDQASDRFHTQALIGHEDLLSYNIKQSAEEKIGRFVLKSGLPVRLGRDQIASYYPKKVFRGRDFPESLIALPLKHEKRIVGIIVADSSRMDAFGGETEKAAQYLLDYATPSLIRSYRQQDLREQTARQSIWMETALALQGAETLESFWDKLLDVLLSETPATGAILYKRADHGFAPHTVAGLGVFMERIFKEGQGIVGGVAKTGAPIAIADRHNDRRDVPVGEDVRSVLALPVRVKGRVDYVLLLGAGLPNSLGIREKELLEEQIILWSEMATMHTKLEEARLSAWRDDLTGLLNRRGFRSAFEEMVARASVAQREVALITIDVDNFKKFNDIYGHTEGDVILGHIARTIKETLPEGAVLSRYGGEEFTVAMEGVAKVKAREIAEAIRHAVENKSIYLHAKQVEPVTVSAGVACYPRDGADCSEVLEQADRALYSAKTAGKNRVAVFAA